MFRTYCNSTYRFVKIDFDFFIFSQYIDECSRINQFFYYQVNNFFSIFVQLDFESIETLEFYKSSIEMLFYSKMKYL